MTTFEIFQTITSIVGILIGVTGFVFLYKQIRQINTSIKSGSNNNLYSQTIELNKFLIENHELRPYFYENKECFPANEHYSKVEIYAEIYGDFWEHILEERENIGKYKFSRWSEWMKDMYKNSPAIRNHLKENSEWYTKEFIDLFKSIAMQTSSNDELELTELEKLKIEVSTQ